MLTLFLTLLATILLARLLSRSLPKQKRYTVLAVIGCLLASPIFGIIAGTIVGLLDIAGPDIQPAEYVRSGMVSGTIAALLSPVLVWLYRRPTLQSKTTIGA
jgi:hypothetical protein